MAFNNHMVVMQWHTAKKETHYLSKCEFCMRESNWNTKIRSVLLWAVAFLKSLILLENAILNE